MTATKYVPNARLRETADGLETLCVKCDEWWPADREFFFSDPDGVHRLFFCCKACYREHYDPRRLTRPPATSSTPFPSLFGAHP